MRKDGNTTHLVKGLQLLHHLTEPEEIILCECGGE